MNLQLKENKRIIRSFMAAQYTDAKLIELLDHARAGKLALHSCCCFIGIPTATHELIGEAQFTDLYMRGVDTSHYDAGLRLDGAPFAERAYGLLSTSDATRRRLLIPMILAELKRRNQLSKFQVLLPEESQEKV